MSYDQGYWHTDKTSELGVDESQAGNHIAVYIRWCLERGFISDKSSGLSDGQKHEMLFAQNKVIEGSMSANEYFSQYMVSAGLDIGPISLNVNFPTDSIVPIGFGPGLGFSVTETVTTPVPVFEVKFSDGSEGGDGVMIEAGGAYVVGDIFQ